MKCYSAIRKDEYLTIYIDVDGTGGDYAKWNKSSRDVKIVSLNYGT